MDDRQLIVLFGDSLLMDGVEASLADKQELDVIRVDATITNVGQHLKSIAPDLVIFDLDIPFSAQIVPLLQEQPGIPFIGLDAQCSEVIALSSQQYTALSANDLVKVIQIQTTTRLSQDIDASFGFGANHSDIKVH
jgi:DNA-binding NarL/FixJ family response regulator